MTDKQFQHITVLLHEAVNSLHIKPNGIYIDGTFGRGGHSKLILSQLNASGRLIAIDRDPEAIQAAKSINDPRFKIKYGSFSKISQYVEEERLTGNINGVLLDLGVSSPQLDNPERGFSFMRDGQLDMRMDIQKGESAQQWLMNAKTDDIIWVLKTFGEERFAKRIARAIVKRNHNAKETPLTRTYQLAELIAKVTPLKKYYKHPATRSFQAIRIYINNELEEIKKVLHGTMSVLAPSGRLSVISFHSLEDRLVKQFIRQNSKELSIPIRMPLTDVQIRNRGAIKLRGAGRIKPSKIEMLNNPRARSSILRFAQRIE
ncbi:Ribosomal RNA small subunit methyltransferase H [Candidatus Hartigia pinicola]|nr:Ribosomal RNA small subunit methyltransferase H [Candidatus Hartigia pinicola]